MQQGRDARGTKGREEGRRKEGSKDENYFKREEWSGKVDEKDKRLKEQ